MPVPVAVNSMPTVFALAPNAVKSVVPTVLILYLLPTTKLPDATDDDVFNETNVPPGIKLTLNVVGDILVT